MKGLNHFRKKFMSHAGVFFKIGIVHEFDQNVKELKNELSRT